MLRVWSRNHYTGALEMSIGDTTLTVKIKFGGIGPGGIVFLFIGTFVILGLMVNDISKHTNLRRGLPDPRDRVTSEVTLSTFSLRAI